MVKPVACELKFQFCPLLRRMKSLPGETAFPSKRRSHEIGALFTGQSARLFLVWLSPTIAL